MTPEDAFRKLSSANAGYAVGLGWCQGSAKPQIMANGPLWRGASQMVGPDARWHIGSITKTITATLAMREVDQGRLGLDAPIGPVLQDAASLHESWKSVTLRQLLSHTSGLPANPPLRLLLQWRDMGTEEGLRKVLQTVWDKPVKGKPGQYRYSNLGFMLVGLMLEKVTGRPWETLVREEIAAPLGLESLGFGPPQGQSDPKGHRRLLFWSTPKERDDLTADNPRWLGPAGTVHMSLPDLLTYGRAHLQAGRGDLPGFLSQQSALAMRTPIGKDYGLGFVLQKDAMWHDGSNTMWYALLIIDPVSDAVVVAAQNTSKGAMRMGRVLQKTVAALRTGE